MPRMKKSDKTIAENVQDNQDGYLDNDFIPLNDLVYAPLHALALSNMQLREAVLESIKSMGTIRQNGQEEVIQMNHINLAYEHIKPEAEEGYSVENLQIEVPLMSIVPVTNLNVKKAEIEFSTEVRIANDKKGEGVINARICSPSQRETDFLPKISYKMQVSSLPSTEGLLRLTDMLSTSQVAKQLDTTPVAMDGNMHTEEEKEIWQQKNETQMKIKQLNSLYQKISQMMDEQEKLQQISNQWNPDDTYQYDREKYSEILSDLANQIMKLKESEVDRTIELNREQMETSASGQSTAENEREFEVFAEAPEEERYVEEKKTDSRRRK